MAAGSFELGTDGPSRILVGVDGSDTSLRAGAYAAGLARRQGARLVVLFVRTASAAAGMAATAGAVRATQDELSSEIRETVRSGVEHVGITAEYVERSGNPYRELLAVADELRVDAIVVGASTQAGHRFVGSLAADRAGRPPSPAWLGEELARLETSLGLPRTKLITS